MPLLKINSKLLPVKLHFFLYHAGAAPILLFGPIIGKGLGYSAFVVGIVYMVIPLLILFSRPFICAFADKYKQRKSVFLISILVTLMAMLLLTITPKRTISGNIALHCHQETYIVNCDDSIKEADYNNVIHQLQEENKNLACQLECRGTSDFAEELCHTWNVRQYCYLDASAVISSFATNSIDNKMKSSNVAEIGKTSMEKQKSAKPKNVPYQFSFNGDISVKNIFQLGNCIYGKILKAEFGKSMIKFHIPYCKRMISTECTVQCADRLLTESFVSKTPSVIFQSEFWMLLFVLVITWIGFTVNNTISDTVCFDLLGVEDHLYGQNKMFSSLGWGLICGIGGLLTDHVSSYSEDKNYTPLLIIASILLVLDFLVVCTIKVNQMNYSVSLYKDVTKLFGNIHIMTFTVCCFYVGLCSALIWQFLYWHVESISSVDDLKWSKTIQGADAVIATIFGELPCFFISGFIIDKIGHVHSMSMILLVLSVRLFCYSLLSSPIWALPVAFLNGLTFGIFYATMTSYANIVALPGTETTTQGIFGTAFDSFGIAVGSMMGGWLFHEYKGAFMYGLFSFITFGIFLVHVLTQYFIKSEFSPEIKNKNFDSRIHYTTPNEAQVILNTN